MNVPVPGNIPQVQSLFQNQQREAEEKPGQERPEHSREDVWTFPEGSSIMAQNIVPLIPTSQIGQNNPSPAMLPAGVLSPANKGNRN